MSLNIGGGSVDRAKMACLHRSSARVLLAAVLLGASPAVAQVDVKPAVSGGKIVTGAVDHTGATSAASRVFGYSFQTRVGDPYGLVDPGFNTDGTSAFTPSTELRLAFSAQADGRFLSFWNGSGTPSFGALPVTASPVALRWPRSVTTWAELTEMGLAYSSNQSTAQSHILTSFGTGGSMHYHAPTRIRFTNESQNLNTNPIPVGAYLISARLRNPGTGVADSDPLFFVFGNGITASQVDTAVSYVASLLGGSGPANSAWAVAGSGSFHSAGSWSPATVPNAAGATATFGTVPSAPASIGVTLDANATLGALTFTSSSTAYTLGGSGTLNLQGSGSNAATLSATAGQHVLSVATHLASPTTATLATGAGVRMGNVLSAGNSPLTVAGGGTLDVAGVYDAGAVAIADDGSRMRLAFGAVVEGTSETLASLRTLAARGLTSNGSAGLVGLSSAGDSRAPFAGIAVVPNTHAGSAGPFFETFLGRNVSASDVLVRYTYRGDTNLDGQLDGNDLADLLEGLSTGATGWENGDFNYDGAVTSADIAIFQSAFANQGAAFAGPAGTPGSAGAIPEPSALGLLAATSLLVGRRRR